MNRLDHIYNLLAGLPTESYGEWECGYNTGVSAAMKIVDRERMKGDNYEG